MKPAPAGRCPFCGGSMGKGKTTYAADLGAALVVVRDVPATVCGQCGESWIGDSVAASIERVVDEARRSRKQVEILSLGAAPA